MKSVILVISILVFVSFFNYGYGQLYQGPAAGLVTGGVIVNTGNFDNYGDGVKLPPTVYKKVRNKINFELYPENPNVTKPSAPEGANYMDDPLVVNKSLLADPIIFKSFQGTLDPGGFIPPDLHMAVGPTNIITVDNGRFKIWDKEGHLVKSIDADIWFSTALNGAGAFDPKVVYDHFAKRWVMVWLDQNDNPARGYYLVSVSDDSIPTGTWYNWALPSTVNGTTYSNSWGDYQGVGFDNGALYITSNQFAFGGNFQGTRIRIIPKADLYANTGGVVNWKDLWDIREPSQNSRTFGARPTIFMSLSSEYYLLVPSPFTNGTFFTLYKITNPLTTPVMTAVNVPVTAFTGAPNANQLGGSVILIEAGGSGLRNEPVYKDGFIWAVHSVKNTTYTSYSSVRYVKINTTSNTTAEDVAMGANGFWHFYPAICVDKDNNIAITYSRSGTNEYIGAFFTSKLNGDPPGLSGSKIIQAGKANYFKDFSSGRNRWGDYNGIWLDATDKNNFWVLTEYAETPNNTWAGWVAGLRLVPFTGAKIYVDKDSLDFGVREAGFGSDTLTLRITGQGQDTLLISGMNFNNNQFSLLTAVNYPIKLGYNQVKEIKFRFLPSVHGLVKDTLRISSNDGGLPIKNILLKGKGYIINPAAAGVIYGITGVQSGGSFIRIDKNTGNSYTIGSAGYSDITGLSVRPSDNNIFGVISGGSVSNLVRINSLYGDAYPSTIIPISSIRTIAFDLNDDLFCGTQDGKIYKFSLLSKDTSYIGNTGISNLYSLAINPLNGTLWGTALNNKVYKINKTNGISNLIGAPGFATTPSICFNHIGKMFGTTGIGVQTGILIGIDTATGVGYQIGSTNITGLNSIAISKLPVKVENIGNEVPNIYRLSQNYPNPFNPVTKIGFDVPLNSFVSIRVYDLVGKEIAILVNENVKAGSYFVEMNGGVLSSGIYFYKMTAGSFSKVMKMVLMK